jgi:CheY-like chemotaxis protein
MSVSSGEITNIVNQGKALVLLKDDLRERNESGSGNIHGGEGSYQTVLIVNDDQDQLDLMGILLRQSGYHIITAEDGREGYEVALAERPDLVISDVSMPCMNGIEMCGLIRENEDLKRIPVLLISVASAAKCWTNVRCQTPEPSPDFEPGLARRVQPIRLCRELKPYRYTSEVLHLTTTLQQVHFSAATRRIQDSSNPSRLDKIKNEPEKISAWFHAS